MKSKGTIPKQVLYYGFDEPLPERIPLRAGPLTLFFENGDLRHIRCGEREILRRVYVAVRDRAWGTVSPQINNLQIKTRDDSFHILFAVVCRQAEIDFRWRGEIHGAPDGEINFNMAGRAYSQFWRNRIGFCVLHPIAECAGQPCEVEHTDGEREAGLFPQFISPHQPFKDIRAIRHQVFPGLHAEMRLQGDVFEMEDQRNWTDASYKIYSTPLEQPWPVLVAAGDEVRQAVRLTLSGDISEIATAGQPAKPIKIDPSSGGQKGLLVELPQIGLGLTTPGAPYSPQEIERLRALHLDHLRVDLWLGEDDWQDDLRWGVEASQALSCALEFALHLTDQAQAELTALLSAVRLFRPEIARWIIFHVNELSTAGRWVDLARKALAEYAVSTPVGCGADTNFTELNRQPPALQPPDFLVYAANPQVHAFDNLSLIENIAGLAQTVVSARKLAQGKPVVISPLTLKQRDGGREPAPRPSQRPASVDPRQISLFGAGWTLGAIKALAEQGAHSMTLYETTGWRGVMESEEGSPLPEIFPSQPGMVYPLYHVLADIGDFSGGQVALTETSAPLQSTSLALRLGDRRRLLAANLDRNSVEIQVANLPLRVEVKFLDGNNASDALLSPKSYRRRPGKTMVTEDGCLNLKLAPYAIVRIDYEGE